MNLETTRIKKSEQWAYEYLVDRGFADLIYEPDGNVPPDFLIDGYIAVEARRLNQNEESTGGYRGLEEVWQPLDKLVQKVVASTFDKLSSMRAGLLYTISGDRCLHGRNWRG